MRRVAAVVTPGFAGFRRRKRPGRESERRVCQSPEIGRFPRKPDCWGGCGRVARVSPFSDERPPRPRALMAGNGPVSGGTGGLGNHVPARLQGRSADTQRKFYMLNGRRRLAVLSVPFGHPGRRPVSGRPASAGPFSAGVSPAHPTDPKRFGTRGRADTPPSRRMSGNSRAGSSVCAGSLAVIGPLRFLREQPRRRPGRQPYPAGRRLSRVWAGMAKRPLVAGARTVE